MKQSRARAAGKKHPKKRGQRATSNIFAMFDQAQIQEFKEVKCCHWFMPVSVSVCYGVRDEYCFSESLTHTMFASNRLLT